MNGAAPAVPNSDDPWSIGAAGSSGANPYQGQVDEFALYNRSLSGAEIYSLYLRELRWYRDRGASIIQVDGDLPLVEMQSGAYHDNNEVDLVFWAVDPTSRRLRAEFGLKAPLRGLPGRTSAVRPD
jgi:hypothetical protein